MAKDLTISGKMVNQNTIRIDIDEIFALPALKVGVPVIIFGQQFSLEDAMSLNEERPGPTH